MQDSLVIGLDYGTDSVRAILVNARNGQQIAFSVFNYPRWQKGLYCDASKNRFRQHPQDYIDGFEYTVKSCIEQAGGAAIAPYIKAIAVDTTGSTPVAVNTAGRPACVDGRVLGKPGCYVCAVERPHCCKGSRRNK